ncbi:MAG: sulfatase-like hydrolase/transferase [Sedimentisphaerales bacterium]|nr:sulfatase-like hydrolase/transferase [Sedimentisphaerales bacterium]
MENSIYNRPNIIFILADDLGAWIPNDEIRTPNLRRLAASGLTFNNFFCVSPVCSPARATLLTGQIPSQHGIHDWLAAGDTTAKYEPSGNGELIEYLQGQPGYTDSLSRHGYVCGISGKWHLGDSHHPQKSFQLWKVHALGGGPYYNAPLIRNGEVYEEPGYVTDVITDNALQWLEEQKTTPSPFYLSVHFTAPHSPWTREHHPLELYEFYYRHCPFTSVPDGLAPPTWVQRLNIPVENAQMRRDYLSGYYAATEAMDANIGKLLDWLEANHLRDNTMVIFTSDNGMNMGHHGVFGKGNATFPLNLFEESVKVPFIVSHPGHILENRINNNLVSQYDFPPTLLDYVGINCQLTQELPGKSFASLLRGMLQDTHDHVVVFNEYGPVRMVRTPDWKYIHRFSQGPNELYHLKEDPGEQTNLAGNISLSGKEKEMRQRLRDWFFHYVNPLQDGANKPITGSGQLNFSNYNK